MRKKKDGKNTLKKLYNSEVTVRPVSAWIDHRTEGGRCIHTRSQKSYQ